MKRKQSEALALSFHPERCIHHWLEGVSCRFCIEACPYQALSQDEGTLAIHSKLCQDCGRCVNACPSRAFSLNHPANYYHDHTLLLICQSYPLNPTMAKKLVKSPCYMGLNPYDLANLIIQNKKLVFLYDETICQNCHQFHKNFLLEALKEIFLPFQAENFEPLFINEAMLVNFLKNHTPQTDKPTTRRRHLKSSFKFALNTMINYLGDQSNLASLREKEAQSTNLFAQKCQTLKALKERYPIKPKTFLPLYAIVAKDCSFCGHCVRLCPTKALEIIRTDRRYLVWHPTKCENCNFCILACPKHYLDFTVPLSAKILLEETRYMLWQERPHQLFIKE